MGSEFVSDSANSRIRVGVDTFSGVSELSSGGACFPSSSTNSQMSVDWKVVFGLGELGVKRWLEKPPDPSAVSRACLGAENKGCALRHVVGVA